jgi:ribosome biogenesis GTPase
MDTLDQLEGLGLNAEMKAHARVPVGEGLQIARVVAEHRESYVVRDHHGLRDAEVAGKFRFSIQHREQFPCVGDWVAVAGDTAPAVIHRVLPRRSLLSRRAAGDKTERQPIAANMDIVFVMQGLDLPFNARRIERSIVIVRESGALPAILLGKSDLLELPDVEALVEAARRLLSGVEVLSCSSVTGEGIGRIREMVGPGITGCIVGPSGAGKSRLINTLAGEPLLAVREVRESDARGRHTTTLRQLVSVPDGGMLIDTPGMREIGLWHSETGLGETFPEIGELAEECRFRDCTHTHEPGCAVLRALDQGALAPDRYESYCKLRDEGRAMEERTTLAGRLERKRREKILSREIGRVMKRKGKR